MKTIVVSEDFHAWLIKQGNKGESFDKILKRLTNYRGVK